MTKRRFLAILSSAVAGVLATRYFRPRLLNELAESFVPQLPAPKTTGALSLAEMTDLIALGEVIVDARDLSEEEKDCLRRHINDRTENDPGFLSPLPDDGRAAATTGAAAVRVFVPDGTARLGGETPLIFVSGASSENFLPWGKEQRVIRALAVSDMVTGYYRSAAGWAVVGYKTFPGNCGDLSRYTRAGA